MTPTRFSTRIVSALACATAAIAVVFTCALLRYAWLHGYFYGDDYTAFLLARLGHLPEALFVPVGGQVVPLHRALAFFVWRVAPMNYALALTVLMAFHVLGIVYLYRLLTTIGASPFNKLLVSLYACYPLMGPNLVWFSAGVHRFPYVAFSLVGMYHYVLYRRDGRGRHLVVLGVSTLIALGFYPLACLIPIYCVGFEFAERWTRRDPVDRIFQSRGAGEWLVLGSLVLVTVAMGAWSQTLLDPAQRRINTDVPYVLSFLAHTWRLYANSLVGRILEPNDGRSSWLVGVGWGLFALYSVRAAPRLAVVWAIGCFLVTVNLLILGVSDRTVFFRDLIIFEYRHYFDFTFVAVLFLGLLLHRLGALMPETASGATPAWLAPACVVAGLVIAVRVSVGYEGFLRAARFNPYMDETRTYMRTLQGDLAQLHAEGHPIRLADAKIPRCLDPLDFNIIWLSQLAQILPYDMTFVADDQADYTVEADGHLTLQAR